MAAGHGCFLVATESPETRRGGTGMDLCRAVMRESDTGSTIIDEFCGCGVDGCDPFRAAPLCVVAPDGTGSAGDLPEGFEIFVADIVHTVPGTHAARGVPLRVDEPAVAHVVKDDTQCCCGGGSVWIFGCFCVCVLFGI